MLVVFILTDLLYFTTRTLCTAVFSYTYSIFIKHLDVSEFNFKKIKQKNTDSLFSC